MKYVKDKLGRYNKYSDEYLLNSLRKLSRSLKRTPTIEEVKKSSICPSPRTYKDHFGSFVKGIEAAGLQPYRYHRTREQLIESLKHLYKKLGKTPTHNNLGQKNSMPSSKYFIKKFGSYNNALKIAGIPVNKENRNYTKKELIKLLKSFAKKIGKTPRKKDIYKDKNMPDPETYTKRFGSFNNAIEFARLKITNSKFFYYSDEQLLNLLIKVAKKLGRTPNKYDFKNLKELPSVWIYSNRFGSYNNSVFKAGLRPNGGFADKLAYGWQNHCIEIAKFLYGNIETDKGHSKKVGKPDIWVKDKKLYIDAKLSLYHKKHVDDQINRYTKDGYNLQFWCLIKDKKFEVNNKKIDYVYAEDLLSLPLTEELIAKTHQFINRIFSHDQKLIKEFMD